MPGNGGAATNSIVGFGSGLVGGLTAMPGALPIIWCEWRGVPKERQRAMVQPFILLMQIFAVAMLFVEPGDDQSRASPQYRLCDPGTARRDPRPAWPCSGVSTTCRFRLAVLGLLFISGCLMLR